MEKIIYEFRWPGCDQVIASFRSIGADYDAAAVARFESRGLICRVWRG